MGFEHIEDQWKLWLGKQYNWYSYRSISLEKRNSEEKNCLVVVMIERQKLIQKLSEKIHRSIEPIN